MNIKSLFLVSALSTITACGIGAAQKEEANPDKPVTPTEVSDLDILSCPTVLVGKDTDIAKKVETLISQNKLRMAAELAGDCAQFGTSADSRIIDPVNTKLFSNLNAVLSGRIQGPMESVLKHCENKGKDMGGAAGDSFESRCKLRVLEGYSTAYRNELN